MIWQQVKHIQPQEVGLDTCYLLLFKMTYIRQQHTVANIRNYSVPGMDQKSVKFRTPASYREVFTDTGHNQVHSRQRAVWKEVMQWMFVLDTEPPLQPDEKVLLFGSHQFSQSKKIHIILISHISANQLILS